MRRVDGRALAMNRDTTYSSEDDGFDIFEQVDFGVHQLSVEAERR